MVRYFTLAVLLLFTFTMNSNAQQARLNIEAGPNFSTFSASDGTDFESGIRAGTHIGVSLDYGISEKWDLYAGIGLSENNFERTYKSTDLENGNSFPSSFDLSYSFKMVEFPFGLKYKLTNESFDVGFSAGFTPVITSGNEGERASDEVAVRELFDLTDEIQKSGLLVEPGVSLSYALDKHTQVFAGISYGFDVFELYERENEARRLHRLDLKVGLSIALF